MNIVVAGYGFVGKVHALALEGKHRVAVHDPDLGYIADFNSADAVIIAVSTPESVDGSCNMQNVYTVLSQCPNVPVLIKSTISIEGWKKIQQDFELPVTFSPEYLRAKHALDDFRNQSSVQIGGGDVEFWATLLSDCLDITIQVLEPQELILTKYARNSFLALKVAYFNQLHDLCNILGVDADTVLYQTTQDDRIGSSHSFVTQERGFGGHCLPKDTAALTKTAEHFGYNFDILKTAVEYNNKVRNK